MKQEAIARQVLARVFPRQFLCALGSLEDAQRVKRAQEAPPDTIFRGLEMIGLKQSLSWLTISHMGDPLTRPKGVPGEAMHQAVWCSVLPQSDQNPVAERFNIPGYNRPKDHLIVFHVTPASLEQVYVLDTSQLHQHGISEEMGRIAAARTFTPITTFEGRCPYAEPIVLIARALKVREVDPWRSATLALIRASHPQYEAVISMEVA
jgi:hypothetical protein